MKSGVEQVWNDISSKMPDAELPTGATGGGVSKLCPCPSWQADLVVKPGSKGSPEGRVVPDVAGLASGADWLINMYVPDAPKYTDPTGVCGTSAVAPLYAALVTLANEVRAERNKGPVGFFNEALYQRAKKDQASLFVDIVTGNNAPKSDYPGYEALQGFDACTGWGVPNNPGLFDFLVSLP